MQQQSVIHDPYAGVSPTARGYAIARRERLARIAGRAVSHQVPETVKIEIREIEPDDTKIEVTSCNGQIVMVTKNQVIEARALFERISIFEGGAKTSVDKIQRAVCKKFGITRVDLLSARRTQKLVIPRQVAMYLCKTLTFKSLPEIGRRFNGRDHTTVLHSVRKMAALIQRDEVTRTVINEIQAELSGEGSV